ncbi:ABC transporter ATP-binding protein [candidate division KSB1 bacterium]
MEPYPVIEVRKVSKSYKTVKAVDGIDLQIMHGQFVALLGPNGAGKTTLVEMIEGIRKPDEGEILVMGKKWKGNEDELHQILGLSLQETQFIDKLTVWETLRLFASFFMLGKERANEIIDIIGLQEKRKSFVVNLSGGQRQRLALGIALINKPKILLLDEPTTGLDPNVRREIWSILHTLKKESETSLILTTHYMEEAEELCDYIIIVDKGRILRQGTLDQLLAKENGDKVIEFTLDEEKDIKDKLVADKLFNIRMDQTQAKGTVVLKEVEKELPDFLEFLKSKHLRLINLECRRKTLDDIFTSLTGRHLYE